MTLAQLKRIRWGVRGAMLLGVAASVVANVLHALDNPISQAIAAWPPLALLLTVELISRVPVHTRALAAARLVATATIAGIAAYVSYQHMVGVAQRYGEVGASPYLLPLSVDGLIVVASICLLELGRRIAAEERPSVGAMPTQARVSAESTPLPGVSIGLTPLAAEQPWATGPRFDYDQPIGPSPAPAPALISGEGRPPRVDKLSTPGRKPRKAHPSAAERVVSAHRRSPKASDEQLAARLNLSTRTVRRHRPAVVGQPPTTAPAAEFSVAAPETFPGLEAVAR